MITLTINRYGFNELDKAAQDRAIEDIRKTEYQNFPDFLMIQDMNTKASELLFNHFDGLESHLKIYYSLSYSQGDGVAFHGEIFASENPLIVLPMNCHRVLISHSGRYYHEYSFAVDLYDIDGEDIDGGEGVKTQIQDISRALAKYGYKWQENYLSDENLKEIAINAGEVFTSAGKWSDSELN